MLQNSFYKIKTIFLLKIAISGMINCDNFSYDLSLTPLNLV
jgi:hypothetical protein